MRTSRNFWTVFEFHLICRLFTIRVAIISLTADSTSAVEIRRPARPVTLTVHVDKRRRCRTHQALWRWMKRHAAVEPSIGHLKSEHRLERWNSIGCLRSHWKVRFGPAKPNQVALSASTAIGTSPWGEPHEGNT